MAKKITTIEAPDSEFLAMQIANRDLNENCGVNAKRQNEEDLDDFFDDRCATKEDVFYEEGDGDFEVNYKKMVQMTQPFRDK